MSLLTRAPHAVTVYPQVRSFDEVGAPMLSDGDPLVVSGMMQPASTGEVQAFGAGVVGTASWTFYCAGPWPGGPHSRVEWQGRVFDQEGTARIHSVSRRTAHVEVSLTERVAESR